MNASKLGFKIDFMKERNYANIMLEWCCNGATYYHDMKC